LITTLPDIDTEPEITIVELARFFIGNNGSIGEVPTEVIEQLLVLLELEIIKRRGAIH
jgi:hypothetical protein|tara:strand:+ start:560 stop:733 length:174 start_codon:yes stop_codon:yes gene_type:complete